MNNPTDFLKEICDEKGIQLECLSFDYIARLTKAGRARHIFGAFWDLNHAAADRIACDKTACYVLLANAGVPAIVHELVSNPLLREGYSETLQYVRASLFFEEFGGKIVLKPNQGTKGQHVFLCESAAKLDKSLRAIFAERNDAAISPYHEIQNEYRVFWLGDTARFAFGKARNETWQHNLSRGATAFELTDGEKKARLYELSAQAAACIGITFATIDIAELPGGELAVMEINSGVQAERLVEQLPHLRPALKEIYEEAVEMLFTTA